MSDIDKKFDYNLVEKKWIKRWEDERIFECNPDSKKKYFVTVAYPYPNSPQHIGHGRTYTLADAHARYMRMKGYNVLFPMAFHYTGTPILGMSRRVEAKDEELINTFKNIYHVPDDTIPGFIHPVNIASYFHSEIKIGMKEMGYSIDWRREFTTIDKAYSRFIAWQFRTLKAKGLVAQGSHPVGWCPNDQNPVSQHDTVGDVEPEFAEYLLVKFKLSDYYVPAATLRPETVFGVTNLWVNPQIVYVVATVDNEKWIISKEASKKLEFLNYCIEVTDEISGIDIIGKIAENPFTKSPIPIYPASFVDADSGTGIVMSVPAHAPYDYRALEDLKKDQEIKNKFNLDVRLNPIIIIESESFDPSVSPARQIAEKYGIVDQNDPRLEKATAELYSNEYYKGKMASTTGEFAGISVSRAKDEVKKKMLLTSTASLMYELVNKPVKCRCGTECVVKVLNDQWFINYGNKDWKDLAHACLDGMDIVPDDIRQEFNYVFDWLKERACARKSGLGTKLPWDREWIIESLSDSVIYMAYYILAKYFNNASYHGMEIENLNDSFFDYVLLGNGNALQVSQECKIPIPMLEQIKSEFAYFYPVDSRHSGRDLVPNHLSFFIFNHVAIFKKENWPKQIVVNGSVLMEGKKMSKSLGNIIPLRTAIEKYGADTIRLAMLISAELLQDADFSFDSIKGLRSRIYDIYNSSISYKTTSLSTNTNSVLSESEDRWLISRLQDAISDVTKSMDRLRVREALHIILYSLDQDLIWYKKRIRAKNRESSAPVILSEFTQQRVKMLAPFAPFVCEEIWENIGNLTSISLAPWPLSDHSKKDIVAEESEQLIMNVVSDLQNIIKITKITPNRIFVYTCASWKQKLYKRILTLILEGKTNFGEIMKQLVADPETVKSKSDPGMVKKIIEDILSDPVYFRNRRVEINDFDEIAAIKDAATLISHEAGNLQTQLIVFSEEDPQRYDPKLKAKFARPYKPALYLE